MAANNLLGYAPSHAAAAALAAVIGVSLIVHVYQNFRYKFWRVTFWMFWGGTCFTAGWIMRVFLSYDQSNRNLYIAQQCLILAGPPIFAAAEYNILGRLMYYLPMDYKLGGLLLSIALVLQAAVECIFIFMIAVVHRRALRSARLPHNVRRLCIMLYGTSTLILIRCIFRAIESFAMKNVVDADQCNGICRLVTTHEWYLYIFEAAPMALYTIWLNVMHPGRYLPKDKTRYLDINGKTERTGPGWIDRRSQWKTFLDPMDLGDTLSGRPNHETFWVNAEQWPVVAGGSFAQGTATNVSSHRSGKSRRTRVKSDSI